MGRAVDAFQPDAARVGGITEFQRLAAIARNQLNIGTAANPEYSEFTGPTFSSDVAVLFVNVQAPGITLAITGPWDKCLS